MTTPSHRKATHRHCTGKRLWRAIWSSFNKGCRIFVTVRLPVWQCRETRYWQANGNTPLSVAPPSYKPAQYLCQPVDGHCQGQDDTGTAQGQKVEGTNFREPLSKSLYLVGPKKSQSSYPAEVRKWLFSIFLCQRCREIWREILVNFFGAASSRVWVSEKKITKISRQKRCEKENFTQISLCWGMARKDPVKFPANFPANNQDKFTDELLQERRENKVTKRPLGQCQQWLGSSDWESQKSTLFPTGWNCLN